MFEIIYISTCILFICSFLSLLESSIIYTDELKTNYLLSKHKDTFSDSKKELIKKIIFKKDQYVSALAIISTGTNIVGSGLVGALTAKNLNSDETLIFMISFVYFMLIFSKILPKLIAIDKFDFFLNKFAYLINIIYYLTTPILLFTMFWIKLFKPKKQSISSKELKTIIHYYTEKGAIHSMEEDMIDKLLSIKKTTVADILKDKEPVLKLDYKRKIKKYRLDIINNKNKIYVVQKNNEPVGVAFYRDIADLLLNEDEVQHKVSKCLKTAFFINSQDDIFDAILKFKKNRDRYAIVLNSDNDVVGVITAKQVYTFAIR
jgi:CBS domain containing-hemolysin-like protein